MGALIERHRALLRRLAAASGRVIDWAGDGCFLTCETPSAADCALCGARPEIDGRRNAALRELALA